MTKNLKATAKILDNNGKIIEIDLLSDPRVKHLIKFGGEVVIPEDNKKLYHFMKELQKINSDIKIVKKQEALIKDYGKVLENLHK